MQQDYLIAGLRVRMDTWGRTEEQAKPYLTPTDGEADIIIASVPADLENDQQYLSEDDCEYLYTGAGFYRQLLPFDGLMLHASAVIMDGYAYLFSAPSGTGKSTHTTMWRETFGTERVQMLNDDKPALRLEDGRWYAYGTPWSGKTAQNINAKVPLGGICVLTRGENNEITPFGGTQAVLALMEQTIRPASLDGRGRLLELIDNLLNAVPMWKLKCTPTHDAARVSQKAMAEEAKKRFE